MSHGAIIFYPRRYFRRNKYRASEELSDAIYFVVVENADPLKLIFP